MQTVPLPGGIKERYLRNLLRFTTCLFTSVGVVTLTAARSSYISTVISEYTMAPEDCFRFEHCSGII